jgi:hypothetical protein
MSAVNDCMVTRRYGGLRLETRAEASALLSATTLSSQTLPVEQQLSPPVLACHHSIWDWQQSMTLLMQCCQHSIQDWQQNSSLCPAAQSISPRQRNRTSALPTARTAQPCRGQLICLMLLPSRPSNTQEGVAWCPVVSHSALASGPLVPVPTGDMQAACSSKRTFKLPGLCCKASQSTPSSRRCLAWLAYEH